MKFIQFLTFFAICDASVIYLIFSPILSDFPMYRHGSMASMNNHLELSASESDDEDKKVQTSSKFNGHSPSHSKLLENEKSSNSNQSCNNSNNVASRSHQRRCVSLNPGDTGDARFADQRSRSEGPSHDLHSNLADFTQPLLNSNSSFPLSDSDQHIVVNKVSSYFCVLIYVGFVLKS